MTSNNKGHRPTGWPGRRSTREYATETGSPGEPARSRLEGGNSAGARNATALDPYHLDAIIFGAFDGRGGHKARVAETYARFDRMLADEIQIGGGAEAAMENLALALRSIAKQRPYFEVAILGRIAWIAHEIMLRAGQGDLPHKSSGVEITRTAKKRECAAVWRRMARVIHAEISWRALGAEPKTTDQLASILIGEIGLGRTPMMALDGADWRVTVRNTNTRGTGAADAPRRKGWLRSLFS